MKNAISEMERQVGHLHPEHEEPEELVEHGEIRHRKVKFGRRLSIPKFNG